MTHLPAVRLQLDDDVSLEDRFVGEVMGVSSSAGLGNGLTLIVKLLIGLMRSATLY